MDLEIKKYLDGKFEALDGKLDRKFEEIDRKFEAIDRKFEAIDRKFEEIDRKLDELSTEIRDRTEKVETNLLTAFHNWARGIEIRLRTLPGFDERLGILEDRV